MGAGDRGRSSRVWPWLAVATLLLAGCASVPLSTLWKMRDFDARTVQQLEPAALRAAIAIEPTAAPKRDSVRLQLELTRADGGTDTHAFALEPSGEAGPRDDNRDYSVWKLDAAGRDALTRVQQALRVAEQADVEAYSAASFSVTFNPDFGGVSPDSATLWVQLHLDPEDGWLLLFDEVVVEIAHVR